MKLLIIEDEIPAYQKLVSYLNKYFDIDVLHDWVRSNKEAKKLFEDNVYDLILSDIQLLDGISFDIFDNVKITSPIIFCSAHNEYLFQAFNSNGIAYILKPYLYADFKKAIEKYQSFFKRKDYSLLDSDTINTLKKALKEKPENYKKRFAIKSPKGIQLLNVSDISVIEASGDFCIAHDGNGKRHIISQNIGIINEQLDPNKFFKINRSKIIHLEFITNIENYFKNRLLITLKGCNEKVITSSSKTTHFRKWLER